MKTLTIIPDGWPPCTYEQAPAGHILVDDQLCFKSEYRTCSGDIEGYNSAGEFLCIEPDHIVQPCIYKWEETEL